MAGRPRLVTTAQVVAALDASKSIREASDKLGVWHGAITQRQDSEIIAARARMITRRLQGRKARRLRPGDTRC